MTATTLRDLHVPGSPLVLPNVWDADGAGLVEAAGFPVVATSSWAVAASLGYPDGERAPVDEMFAAAHRISRAVSVPVTVDAESGYRLPPAELVDRLAEAGAVGCNIEDTAPGRGARGIAEQADLLAAIRQAAGDRLVINARVDVFLHAEDPYAVLAEGIERAAAYLAAGADCVYPILLGDPDVIATFVDAVGPAPVNITYVPGGPDVAELGKLGVARISLATGLWRAARSVLLDKLAGLAAGTMPY